MTLDEWDSLSPGGREAYARRLVRSLPAAFTFDSVVTFQMGDRRRDVARFGFGGSAFALVPGGAVTLGYDAGRPWEPTPDEAESWRASAEEYGFAASPRDHIAQVTRRRRVAELCPFLAETTAREVGWEPLPADDAEVLEIVKQYMTGPRASKVVKVHGAVRTVRVIREPGGITAQRSAPLTHAQLARRLGDAGFRLPTSDEWEFLCGAGAETLFRWGDHAPADHYPGEASRAEREWNTRWALSGGTLERPAKSFEPDFDLNLRPSACGVFIAWHPHEVELVCEPEVTRGGDGGISACGGVGFFHGWLPLATAFYQPESCDRAPQGEIHAGYNVARRVLPLD